jgi:hypothetical protein
MHRGGPARGERGKLMQEPTGHGTRLILGQARSAVRPSPALASAPDEGLGEARKCSLIWLQLFSMAANVLV